MPGISLLLDLVDLIGLIIIPLFGLWLYAIYLAAKESPGNTDRTTRRKRRRRRRPWPLDATGWTLLVDGSNFARHNDVDKHARLRDLDTVLDRLRNRFRGAAIEVYCDANLRHLFDPQDTAEFKRRLTTRQYCETHNKKADLPLLRDAKKTPKCIVVSGDRFGDDPEIKRRIGVPLLHVQFSGRQVRLIPTVKVYESRRHFQNYPVEEFMQLRADAA